MVATLGMVLPSFTLVYLISLFFNEFLSISWVQSAFKGIRVCVVFLILSAGLKMLKKMKKTTFNLALIFGTLVIMVALSLFSVDFSSFSFILIGGAIGLLAYSIKLLKDKKQADKEDEK